MILFAPNSLIKSADHNLNNAGLDARLVNLEVVPCAFGKINSGTGSGNKTLTLTASGMTMVNSNTGVRVDKAGKYFINAQQLLSTTTTALYFAIMINGNSVAYGYINGSTMKDANASYLGQLNVGDVISINFNVAVTSCWELPHSYLEVFRVGA